MSHCQKYIFNYSNTKFIFDLDMFLKFRSFLLNSCLCVFLIGSNEGTLVMNENEVLYIIEEDKGDGWTRVRKQSGEEGYVPTSYVEITLEKNSKGAVTYI